MAFSSQGSHSVFSQWSPPCMGVLLYWQAWQRTRTVRWLLRSTIQNKIKDPWTSVCLYAAVSKRLRRWRNLICLSSRRDVTSGCPGLGRSATAPVCFRRVLRLWIVCRLHPSVRATAETDCPASSLPTARSRSAFVRRGIQSLICHQKF